MILCARCTSRSSEQSTKHRWCSENMWKVCPFFDQNNKIVWLSNMADTYEKLKRCAKVSVFFFFYLIVRFGFWLAGQANSDHMVGSPTSKSRHCSLNLEYWTLSDISNLLSGQTFSFWVGGWGGWKLGCRTLSQGRTNILFWAAAISNLEKIGTKLNVSGFPSGARLCRIDSK